MSRRLSRILLALAILLSGEVWALGLGEIKLNSALNEPLRAEIELLSATPEELTNLQVAMASAETFDRYGIERPAYLQGIEFKVMRSGRADGNVVAVRSLSPIAEPFLTFLVEASWSRGRLLREYTVLLDPPTFARPSATESTPAVSAPSRSAPVDSGRIERAAPPPQVTEPAPTRVAPPRQTTPPPIDDSPYDTTTGGEFQVQRGDTLWGVAQRFRPDSRLTMNQTMVAIFEANREAFGGNINLLREGAALRIPSADEIFRISRGDALSEVLRQHDAWGIETVAPADDAPPADDTVSRPSLVLVPPDDEYAADDLVTDSEADEPVPLTREEEIEQQIDAIESAEVPQQPSLIEIRDNELAALRAELARIRGEVYVPPEDEPFVDDIDDEVVDDIAIDDATVDDTIVDDEVADDSDEPAQPVVADADTGPSLLDRIMDGLAAWWAPIAGVLVVVGGLLFWFMRRGGDDDEGAEPWRQLDADDADGDALTHTESLRAPTPTDDSIMVVEQETGMRAGIEDTAESPQPDFDLTEGTAEATGQFGSLEDTFSSDTAINLDQSDPIAEADFHMAYGLYDQAADLINGALAADPNRTDLLTKLSEIYFVWGNRDAFVDSAGRLKSAIGDAENADWDKIVIMGQQIAGDDQLFAGAGVGAATKAVDLAFEADMHETGSLDMELIGDPGAAGDVVDLGASDEAVDFMLDTTAEVTGELEAVDLAIDIDSTAESATLDSPELDITAEVPGTDSTAEMPSISSTLESPTIEQQFDSLGGTSELPSLDETIGHAIESSGQSADATAEINLDDLGLDLKGMEQTEVASLEDLDDTNLDEALEDPAAVTGKNPEVDPNATGVQRALRADDTGFSEALSEHGGTDVDIDSSLLDATGVTQVLSDDLADELSGVERQLGDSEATMLAGYGDEETHVALGDDDATMLSGFDDDGSDDDFDFAKTEALPAGVFTGDPSLEETGELPAVASTDVDLDLDDLTAALQVSEMGDTVEQLRDDATVQQPRPNISDDENAPTMALEPGDMSDDLADARTMTEVGTKLDLARAYVDMGDPAGARSILEEVLDEGDEAQRQQAQQLLDSLPS